MGILSALSDARRRALLRVRLAGANRAYEVYSRRLRANGTEPSMTNVISQLATHAQVESDTYREWVARLRLPLIRHRKYWEFSFIMQALAEHDMLRAGRSGLGFGVGKEPLTAMMASLGCNVLASDASAEHAIAAGWKNNDEHASGLEGLNEAGICSNAAFAERARFRVIDMNHIPADVRGFDFCWSSCAFEHLGSIDQGLAFVESSLDCVVPGGLAVHTTEFNLSSDERTVERGETVLFRRRDVERLAQRLRASGHRVDVNYHPGYGELDRHVDVPPYQRNRHVKLMVARFVTTSFGLIVQKAG